MSESTYSKFTAHLPYVAANRLVNSLTVQCRCGLNPAPDMTRGGASTHPCPGNLRIVQSRTTQLPTRSVFATAGHDWIEDRHGSGIAEPALPRRSPQCKEALLIRAFLRSQKGRRNCRHNSSRAAAFGAIHEHPKSVIRLSLGGRKLAGGKRSCRLPEKRVGAHCYRTGRLSAGFRVAPWRKRRQHASIGVVEKRGTFASRIVPSVIVQ